VIAAAAEPLYSEDRPHLELIPTPTFEPEEETIEAAPLSMARVTSQLQLLLAARRAARLSDR
jgi:hypothetical protein